MQISFKSFRQWKGTDLQHQTKDPWIVKEFLGHKSIRSTEIYITYEKTIYESSNDEYTIRVTKDSDEIKRLLEVGFEFHCHKGDEMFLRKRK